MQRYISALSILFISFQAFGEIETLDNLEAHQRVLKNAFFNAEEKIIISSPQISIKVIEKDKIIDLITEVNTGRVAKGRNELKVVIYTDLNLNRDHTTRQLKFSALEAYNKLKSIPNVKIKFIGSIESLHAKLLIVDNSEITSGSFNWLGAVRDKESEYFRFEHSFRITGEGLGFQILKASLNLKALSLCSLYEHILAGSTKLVNVEKQPINYAPNNILAAEHALERIIIYSFHKNIMIDGRNCDYLARAQASFLFKHLINFIFKLPVLRDRNAFFDTVAHYSSKNWMPVILSDTFRSSSSRLFLENLFEKGRKLSWNRYDLPSLSVEKQWLEEDLNNDRWPYL